MTVQKLQRINGLLRNFNSFKQKNDIYFMAGMHKERQDIHLPFFIIFSAMTLSRLNQKPNGFAKSIINATTSA